MALQQIVKEKYHDLLKNSSYPWDPLSVQSEYTGCFQYSASPENFYVFISCYFMASYPNWFRVLIFQWCFETHATKNIEAGI